MEIVSSNSTNVPAFKNLAQSQPRVLFKSDACGTEHAHQSVLSLSQEKLLGACWPLALGTQSSVKYVKLFACLQN